MAMNPRLLRPLASGFNPRQIAGLGAWFDAANDSSLSVSSGSVAEWRDLSGNSIHLSQSDSAKRPALSTVSGKPAVLFDGSNDFLASSIAYPTGDSLSVVYVASSTGLNGRVFDTRGSGPSGTLVGWQAKFSNATDVFTLDDGSGNTLESIGVSRSGTALVSTTASLTSLADFTNGRIVATDSGSLSGFASGNNLYVGANANGATTQLFNGYLMEGLVYNRSLTTSERQRVEGYLAWKWGLQSQLPYDHPYAKSFPGYGSQTTPTDSDALTYLAAVAAADGTGVEVGVANAVDDFVKGCKADGIWSAIKAACFLAGPRTLAGINVPLVGPTPTFNAFTASEYNRETGLVGNGSSMYIDSGYALTGTLQNNRHVAIWAHTPHPTGTASAYFGSALTANQALARTQLLNNTTDLLITRCADETSNTSAGADNVAGLLGVSRAVSGSYVRRANATNTTVTQASLVGDENNMHIFRRNTTGASATLNTSARLAFYSVGESLTLSLLESRLSAYMTAIGAAL